MRKPKGKLRLVNQVFTRFNLVSRENPAETKAFYVAGVSLEDTVIFMLYLINSRMSKWDIKSSSIVSGIPESTCDFTFTPAYKAIFWD